MPNASSKLMSQKDFEQVIRQAQNDVNATVGVDGFLVGKVGRKITQTITTTTVTGDTSVFSFYENSGSTHLYDFTIIYTDATQTTFLSAERTA